MSVLTMDTELLCRKLGALARGKFKFEFVSEDRIKLWHNERPTLIARRDGFVLLKYYLEQERSFHQRRIGELEAKIDAQRDYISRVDHTLRQLKVWSLATAHQLIADIILGRREEGEDETKV